jgi:hypothetical protein
MHGLQKRLNTFPLSFYMFFAPGNRHLALHDLLDIDFYRLHLHLGGMLGMSRLWAEALQMGDRTTATLHDHGCIHSFY